MLLTKELRKSLPPIGSTEGLGDAATVRVKYFSPFAPIRWYATEFDGEDTFYGYVVNGDVQEWGYWTLSEMQAARVFGNVPAVERDMYFTPCTVLELPLEG